MARKRSWVRFPSAPLRESGPRQAVGIIHRREIQAADDPEQERDRLADLYQERQFAISAARQGVIDEVILPSETRPRLAAALHALAAKVGASGGAGNIPL